MNLQLDNAYENLYEDGKQKEEPIGEIFIRCNNVLFIREDVALDEDSKQTEESADGANDIAEWKAKKIKIKNRQKEDEGERTQSCGISAVTVNFPQ